MTDCIPQLVFSFYRHQPIQADFCGGQITSDAGLLPLRAFDQRHHLTRDLAQLLSDPASRRSRPSRLAAVVAPTHLPDRGWL
jgi:DDE family transposase